MRKALFLLMTELSSRKWISRLAGKIAKASFSRRWIGTFVRLYGIDPLEAEKAVDEYASLNEFFTRRLAPGARPIDEHPEALVSPVDARIAGMGKIRDGLLINVKGQDYTVEELLNRSPRAVNYRGGFFFVLYLSPADYHRIHSPVAGKLVESEHIPGTVYPVHDFGMRHMRKILSRNERLVTYIRHELGEIAVVKIGAMNVNGIRYADGLSDRLERGGELAMFEFGSTVVLLTQTGTFEPREGLAEGHKVRMGERLGLLRKEL
jgi:phosphatidylserine decarboxylase